MAPQGYFFYFDKTTKQETIIQLVTVLLIYKVLQHQDESFLLTCIVIYLQFNINDRHISLILILVREKNGGQCIKYIFYLLHTSSDFY